MQSRPVALVGLLAMGLVAIGLLKGRLGLDQAGLRTAAVLVAALVADRVVVPVCRELVGARRADPPLEGTPEKA